MSEARTSQELRAARTLPESPPQGHGPSFTAQAHQDAELAVAADPRAVIRDLEAEPAQRPSEAPPAGVSVTEVAECAQCAQLDDALGSTLDERDRLAELLDEMTAA
ncbi:hypothetical protein, partial [Streptomyces sp. NPDC056056]|uniref:hypothetical protein n=1 Tax=Streptomyces sp. NPDC056056 TaxID=3345698 RepID=UPI0035D8EE3C